MQKILKGIYILCITSILGLFFYLFISFLTDIKYIKQQNSKILEITNQLVKNLEEYQERKIPTSIPIEGSYTHDDTWKKFYFFQKKFKSGKSFINELKTIQNDVHLKNFNFKDFYRWEEIGHPSLITLKNDFFARYIALKINQNVIKSNKLAKLFYIAPINLKEQGILESASKFLENDLVQNSAEEVKKLSPQAFIYFSEWVDQAETYYSLHNKVRNIENLLKENHLDNK